MEFRAPSIAAEQNANAVSYLTKDLQNPEGGRQVLKTLMEKLGGAVQSYPDWHPIETVPRQTEKSNPVSRDRSKAYDGADHTVNFVRGFVTCPYSEEKANQLVTSVNKTFHPDLQASRLNEPLYADNAYPVVVVARNVVLEADGTIRSQDALRWFLQQSVDAAMSAEVAETWWNIRTEILGRPHGSRSSLFVNQHTGSHMRKILEALNNSGLFGPIMEHSLDMLSKKKLSAIGTNLIRSAISQWDGNNTNLRFELRGEICRANVSDTWNDGQELSVSIEVGEDALSVSGFYYPKDDRIEHTAPTGKRKIAEKFV